jgi:hypothetical protein
MLGWTLPALPIGHYVVLFRLYLGGLAALLCLCNFKCERANQSRADFASSNSMYGFFPRWGYPCNPLCGANEIINGPTVSELQAA